jgi:hypothetical protein
MLAAQGSPEFHAQLFGVALITGEMKILLMPPRWPRLSGARRDFTPPDAADFWRMPRLPKILRFCYDTHCRQLSGKRRLVATIAQRRPHDVAI